MSVTASPVQQYPTNGLVAQNAEGYSLTPEQMKKATAKLVCATGLSPTEARQALEEIVGQASNMFDAKDAAKALPFGLKAFISAYNQPNLNLSDALVAAGKALSIWTTSNTD